MSYLDALTSISLKRASDGRILFFPHGALGRGFVIPSEEEHGKLRRVLKRYYVLVFALIIGAAMTGGLVGFIMAPIFIVAYELWARAVTKRLGRTHKPLTLRESFLVQARSYGGLNFWLREIGSLVFVISGVTILILQPARWPVALAAIVCFGFCAILFAGMILARGRVPRSDASS